MYKTLVYIYIVIIKGIVSNEEFNQLVKEIKKELFKSILKIFKRNKNNASKENWQKISVIYLN